MGKIYMVDMGFYCVVLLFYWQSLVEVSAVHKYM